MIKRIGCEVTLFGPLLCSATYVHLIVMKERGLEAFDGQG